MFAGAVSRAGRALGEHAKHVLPGWGSFLTPRAQRRRKVCAGLVCAGVSFLYHHFNTMQGSFHCNFFCRNIAAPMFGSS